MSVRTIKRRLAYWERETELTEGQRLRRSMQKELKIWRSKVLERDNHICRECESIEHLHAHHVKPFYRFPEFRLDVDNGITVCQDCHGKKHKFMLKRKITIKNKKVWDSYWNYLGAKLLRKFYMKQLYEK